MGAPLGRDQVLFSCNQGRLRYLISDREGGVEDFWSQCRTPTRILAWETLGPRATARVMGKCRFIRIMSHGETVVDLSPGMTVEHDAGVAIVLPGEPGTSVPIDTWVTVEIGQSEGIYQIDSKVVRATITPLEGVVPNPKNTHLLIVSYPPSLRVYNQRESYRVGTEFEPARTASPRPRTAGPGWRPVRASRATSSTFLWEAAQSRRPMR